MASRRDLGIGLLAILLGVFSAVALSAGLGMRVRDAAAGGAEVSAVVADSPAARAGLAVGDIIREAAGKPVADAAGLVGRIRAMAPGEAIPLGVERDGWRRRVNLGATPAAQERPPTPRLGLRVADHPADESGPAAASVIAVEPGSTAAGAGLEAGDLIIEVGGRAVGGAEDFVAALQDVGGGVPLELRVRREGWLRTLRLDSLGAKLPERPVAMKPVQGHSAATTARAAESAVVRRDAVQTGDIRSTPAIPIQGAPLNPSGARADGRRANVAVGDFQVKAAKANQLIGDGLREMFMTSLHRSGYFNVVERMDIQGLAAEQALSRSELADSRSGVPSGGMDVAEIMVYGVVSEFEPEAGGVSFSNFLPQLGMAVRQSSKFSEMAIDVRAVEVRTGRVLVAQRIPGTAQSYGGGLGMGIAFGGFSMPVSLSAYRGTPMELAIRDCIQKATYFVINQTPESYYRHP